MSDWTPCGKSPTGSDYTLFRLDDQHAHERIRLADQDAWLLVRESDSIVEFAVFEFHDSNTDGSKAHYMMLLHGSGFSGALRECRHIWWGDNGDGYTFYLNFKVIEAALAELRRWFDGE